MAKTERQPSMQFDLFPLNTVDTVETVPEPVSLLQPPSPSCPEPSTKRRLSPLGEGEQRSIALADTVLAYSLRRSKRRTIGLLIDSEGLRITAPKRSSIKTIEDAIRQKQQWIKSKLNHQQQKAKEAHYLPVQWQDGAVFPYLGSDLVLRLRNHQTQSILLDTKKSELILYLNKPATSEQIGELVKKWAQQQARDIFNGQLLIYAQSLNVQYRSLSLSSAKQRWGTCTAQGAIRLNWRLIHLPLRLIDYVVAHELAHIHEMNHSQRFWNTVASVYPDYAKARKELHQQAPRILSIF